MRAANWGRRLFLAPWSSLWLPVVLGRRFHLIFSPLPSSWSALVFHLGLAPESRGYPHEWFLILFQCWCCPDFCTGQNSWTFCSAVRCGVGTNCTALPPLRVKAWPQATESFLIFNSRNMFSQVLLIHHSLFWHKHCQENLASWCPSLWCAREKFNSLKMNEFKMG